MELKEIAKDSLVSLISFIKENVNEGTKFVKTQVPLLAKEIVNYELARSIFYIIISLVLISLSIYFIHMAMGLTGRANDNPWVAGILLALVGITIFIYYVDLLIRTITAPRIIIINKIKELI